MLGLPNPAERVHGCGLAHPSRADEYVKHPPGDGRPPIITCTPASATAHSTFADFGTENVKLNPATCAPASSPSIEPTPDGGQVQHRCGETVRAIIGERTAVC